MKFYIILFCFSIFVHNTFGEEISSNVIFANITKSCPELLSYTYLDNFVIYIIKQGELLKKVDFKNRRHFVSQLDEQTELFVKLNKSVNEFLEKHGSDGNNNNEIKDSSCLPATFKEKLLQRRKRANNTLEFIRTQFHEKGEGIVRLIAAQVKGGQLNLAKENFQKLGDEDEISRDAYVERITKLAYDNNPENFQNIRHFLWITNLCTQVVTGTRVLLERMKVTEQLDQPEVLMLTGETTTCESFFTDLIADIKPFQDKILEQWAEEIRNGDFEQIHRFLSTFGQRMSDNGILNNHLEKLIQITYNKNPVNLEPILNFLRRPPWISNLYHGYYGLYQGMKDAGHICSPEMFRLVYRIQDAIKENDDSLAADSKDLKEKLDSLMDTIPKIFRGIITGAKCIIKNVKWNENLFPATQAHRDYREVFTYSNSKNKTKQDAYWRLQPVDDDVVSFHIVNDLYKDFPYLAQNKQNKLDTDIINMITTTLPEEWEAKDLGTVMKFTWKVVPLHIEDDGKSLVVNLRNDFGNFYLFAPDKSVEEDGSNREVYTMGKRISPQGKDWKISCSSF